MDFDCLWPKSLFFFLFIFSMIINSWNCQGSCSSEFCRGFKEYKRLFKPDIFCLLEPRTSGSHANSICRRLEYDYWIRAEAVGYSGGIWILWNEAGFSLSLIETYPQFITCEVRFQNNDVCYFCVCESHLDLRRNLWQACNLYMYGATS